MSEVENERDWLTDELRDLAETAGVPEEAIESSESLGELNRAIRLAERLKSETPSKATETPETKAESDDESPFSLEDFADYAEPEKKLAETTAELYRELRQIRKTIDSAVQERDQAYWVDQQRQFDESLNEYNADFFGDHSKGLSPLEQKRRKEAFDAMVLLRERFADVDAKELAKRAVSAAFGDKASASAKAEAAREQSSLRRPVASAGGAAPAEKRSSNLASIPALQRLVAEIRARGT